MRVLVDTHVLIWYLEGHKSLSRTKRDVVIDPANEVFVSAASLWEIAVKISIGKLKLKTLLTDVINQLAVQSIDILTIAPATFSKSQPCHYTIVTRSIA